MLYEYKSLETHFGNLGWPACLNQFSKLSSHLWACNHFNNNKIRGLSLFVDQTSLLIIMRLRLKPLISLFINNNEAEPRAFINCNEAEARDFINCNNQIRGSSLSLKEVRASYFINCKDRIRNEAQASRLMLMRLEHWDLSLNHCNYNLWGMSLHFN